MPAMNRHALIVGIDRYDHLRPLHQPSVNAEAVARALSEHGDFRITRLPERIAADRTGVVVDPDARVTEAEPEGAIIRLFKPDSDHYPDVALLLVAGHGLQRNAGVPLSYLAASDSDPARHRWGLSLKWLGELLQASPVRNQIVWLDTCHSGGILDFRQADPGSGTRCLIAASRNVSSGSTGLVPRTLRTRLLSVVMASPPLRLGKYSPGAGIRPLTCRLGRRRRPNNRCAPWRAKRRRVVPGRRRRGRVAGVAKGRETRSRRRQHAERIRTRSAPHTHRKDFPDYFGRDV